MSGSVKTCLMVLALSLGGLSAPVFAATCNFSSGGSEQTIVMPVPATLTVSRDAANGTLYTSPNVSPGGNAYVTCPSSAPSGILGNLGPQPGIGANQFPIYSNGNPTGLAFQWIYNGTPATSYGTYTYSGSGSPYNTPHAFRLIKVGTVPAGTVVPGGTVVAYGAIGGLNVVDMVLANDIVVTAAACTTPDVTVPLGDHLLSEFKGINTFTTSTSFNITLSNCPAGMKSITYRIDPVTAVLNAGNSVVALDGGSGAAGVGVQLLDGAGAVFPLGTVKTFSAYNTSTGGSYAIAMRARYYQTAATVVAGTANTSMTLTMTYQ
ncbi:fimbrial protein [Paraburkholderia sp. A1RI-2L]|uniref:fimbrial protein n=1 Tax=Paraburkholderia sp. A1RI-2L TaxID=3028367 RepID=UPI003B7C2DF1